MDGFSRQTADAIVLMSVIRYRVLTERLPEANDRGVRQLVILGAGLDTTAFALPAWGNDWRVFEVDHPATQDWKRAQIASLGWKMPPRLVFAPCDFETQDLLSVLDAAGFRDTQPAVVSMFGVILYLTIDATRATLRQLAGLARGRRSRSATLLRQMGQIPSPTKRSRKHPRRSTPPGKASSAITENPSSNASLGRPDSAMSFTIREPPSTLATSPAGRTACDCTPSNNC